MGLSSIVYHEIIYRAAVSACRGDTEEKVALFIASGRIALIDFNKADTTEAAGIRAHLRRLGTPMGPYAVLIAAQASRFSIGPVDRGGVDRAVSKVDGRKAYGRPRR